VWDESDAFVDVIQGFSSCRKDLKWQDRGMPLLRELMISQKIFFPQEMGHFGLECQNMLVEESIKDVQKNYPHACTLAMLVNEYFQTETKSFDQPQKFDKYQALRDMGILVPKPKRGNMKIFGVS
jgi:hypothetical protein